MPCGIRDLSHHLFSNGLSYVLCQVTSWNNAIFLSIGPLGTKFNKISIKIQQHQFKKMHLKMLSAKWQAILSGPQCINIWLSYYNVLNKSMNWRQGNIQYNYKRRQYDETLSATGGCTTANDVILQTVPVPKVTLLWHHDTTRQNTAMGSRRPSAPWSQRQWIRFLGLRCNYREPLVTLLYLMCW